MYPERGHPAPCGRSSFCRQALEPWEESSSRARGDIWASGGLRLGTHHQRGRLRFPLPSPAMAREVEAAGLLSAPLPPGEGAEGRGRGPGGREGRLASGRAGSASKARVPLSLRSPGLLAVTAGDRTRGPCPHGTCPLQSGPHFTFWTEAGAQGQEVGQRPRGSPDLAGRLGRYSCHSCFYCRGMEAKPAKERSRTLAAVVEHLAHETAACRCHAYKRGQTAPTATLAELDIASLGQAAGSVCKS